MVTVDLFTPIQLGPLNLPNRIAMAPMTRNRAAEGNTPRPLMVEYYVQRASAGLLISEGSQITPAAVGYPATPGIHSEEQVAGWRQVTDAVHQRGGHIFLQLWHTGRISHSSLLPGGMRPVAPSAVTPQGEVMTYSGPQPFETPRALDIEEIPSIIGDYRQAAVNARQAGFDGVEIHAANGYLLDQFLRDGTNRRSDAYGGAIENRARLLMEVTDAVVSVWGNGRVGVRLSPLNPFNDMRDANPQATFTKVVGMLNHYPLAYLHITEMGGEAPGEAGPSFDLRTLKQHWKGCYMTNGGYDKARANAALAAGEAEMISFGVPYIANPDLVERLAQDAPLNEADAETFYGGDAKGYTDYPALGGA
jgi:N-ethylmaleimide reductase